MNLLKTGLVAVCVMSLAASCSTYKSCPAYSKQDTIEKQQMIQVLNTAPEAKETQKASL